MTTYSRRYKKMAGAVLLKLKEGAGLTMEEWTIAAFLADKKLAKYFGVDPTPKVMSIEEGIRHTTAAALSHYELSGEGHAFVAENGEKRLNEGTFLFPGEPAWHERWGGRLFLAIVVAVCSAAIGYFLKR